MQLTMCAQGAHDFSYECIPYKDLLPKVDSPQPPSVLKLQPNDNTTEDLQVYEGQLHPLDIEGLIRATRFPLELQKSGKTTVSVYKHNSHTPQEYTVDLPQSSDKTKVRNVMFRLNLTDKNKYKDAPVSISMGNSRYVVITPIISNLFTHSVVVNA
eukprot:GHVU01211202.1.p1 GENE.GHVU01211202.1~~GHVU01211202.1.p1  ORF type:complete len:156 (-),score=10.87 GHVU01211202.1:12-479(-)